ncbi:NAD(P)H-dependent oxidoreductase [Rhodococcus spelaei]|uniref:NAD(P)H-dependent oxidoreductase n=1 Tax=Rhodococcus spelaei TaxID=2546320 RepID=A0A541BPL2_9NOCA|nr:NADPH-dependent FMN reductase [Rhodococcus spelaei]TQF74253.1 NAD(P)H-dependent oxidoreductase [Rhodococcus spelaei]
MRLLLISGSTRAGSTNGAALATLREEAPAGSSAVVYEGLATLPMFNPDDDTDPLPPAVADLRRAIASTDGVVFCTPEYAGTLPGSLKNLLDWTVGGTEMTGRPAAWINVAATGRGRGAADALRTVLGYVDVDLRERACIELPVPREAVGPGGTVSDPTVRSRFADYWHTFGEAGSAPV